MTEVALTPMKDALSKHRTTPLKESLIHVPNYPTKLTIFKLAASRFYWVRYFEDKKIYKRSTKSEDKRTAIEFAKKFYNEINFKNHQGLLRGKEDNFEVCARAVIDQQEFAVLRGEMSAEMAQADKYRLEKEVLPFFRSISVKDIDYFKLQDFMNKLTTDKLHGSTISNYMGLVNKTLKYAHRRAYIAAIPQIPKPVKVDNARGWFTTVEYRLLWEAARRLEGNTFEVRKRKDGEGNEKIFVCERLLPTQLERAKLRREGAVEKKLTKAQLKYQELIKGTEFMRRVDMGDEMHDLIVFMMNTFIRPTDLKWMQHKHIDVIEGENVYLRLRIPTSKKHNKPIVSMTRAVGVYKRMKEKHERRGLGSDNDYSFSLTSKMLTKQRTRKPVKTL